ncbi:MAG: fibro-slime domain-containing protein [Phycisphaerales bacterium]|nr:fibro-slime domain-containing protein [Phycisphaerales bacterium]
MLSKRLIASTLCGLLVLSANALAHELELTGVVRDFKRGDRTGGHPDFETAQTVAGHGKYGLVYGLVTFDLTEDGKPTYNPVRPSNDTIWSEESFNQWYRDVPGVNLSTPYTVKLSNGSDSVGGIYSYSNNRFFPIDGQFFGNEGCKDNSGKERNFHFTFELRNSFNYRAGQRFTFIGDDDVWVYINGKKVIDIGGVHSASTASVLLFDGKAFVAKAQFPVGGIVKSVTSQQATQLGTQFALLGSGYLPG